MNKTMDAVLTAIELRAMQMDGPDEPGFHWRGMTVLDADPKTGVVLVEDEKGCKRAHKLALDPASSEELRGARERWQEKTGIESEEDEP